MGTYASSAVPTASGQARTDQPECFKAYAAKKAEAGKSGLPGRYFEQILQCSCENKPPELCINALEAEPTAAAAPPPEVYLALGGITAAGAGDPSGDVQERFRVLCLV